jgi:tRNA nucleotidyltransferase (CCA-adding enzyme)
MTTPPTRDFIMDWMSCADPVTKLRELRASGWTREYFPELDVLYGVVQPAEHHPEIDTGVHVELVLGVAAMLSNDPRTRWAALVHDLGKGVTPVDQLPQHKMHEEAGVPLARAAGERFGLPDDWVWLGAMTSRHHLQAHRSLDMKGSSSVRFIRKAGFATRPPLFECFLAACEADARGRTGRENNPYPQAPYLREVFAVVREFEVKEMHLEQARTRAVAPILSKYLDQRVKVE